MLSCDTCFFRFAELFRRNRTRSIENDYFEHTFIIQNNRCGSKSSCSGFIITHTICHIYLKIDQCDCRLMAFAKKIFDDFKAQLSASQPWPKHAHTRYNSQYGALFEVSRLAIRYISQLSMARSAGPAANVYAPILSLAFAMFESPNIATFLGLSPVILRFRT